MCSLQPSVLCPWTRQRCSYGLTLWLSYLCILFSVSVFNKEHLCVPSWAEVSPYSGSLEKKMNYWFHGLRSLKIFKVSKPFPSQQSSKDEFIDWLILLSNSISTSVSRGQGEDDSLGSFCLFTDSLLSETRTSPGYPTSNHHHSGNVKPSLFREAEWTQPSLLQQGTMWMEPLTGLHHHIQETFSKAYWGVEGTRKPKHQNLDLHLQSSHSPHCFFPGSLFLPRKSVIIFPSWFSCELNATIMFRNLINVNDGGEP